MIVDNLNVFRVRARPAEAHPELIVHADAVLPSTVAFQGFQPVTRWDAQVVHLSRLVQLLQFPARHGFEVGEARYALPVEQGFGVGALERLDHERILTLRMINVKRDYRPNAKDLIRPADKARGAFFSLASRTLKSC